MLFQKFVSAILSLCFLTSCFTVFAQAITGTNEYDFTSVFHTAQGNVKRIITNRTDYDSYTALVTVSAKAAYGSNFDSRGETYQVFFDSFAVCVEYDEQGTQTANLITSETSAGSLTVDGTSSTIELKSKKLENEKIIDSISTRQYIWQIEADGDYNTFQAAFTMRSDYSK